MHSFVDLIGFYCPSLVHMPSVIKMTNIKMIILMIVEFQKCQDFVKFLSAFKVAIKYVYSTDNNIQILRILSPLSHEVLEHFIF